MSVGRKEKGKMVEKKNKNTKEWTRTEKKTQNSNNNKEQESQRQKKRLRACLHGGGGPQVGEVTRFGG